MDEHYTHRIAFELPVGLEQGFELRTPSDLNTKLGAMALLRRTCHSLLAHVSRSEASAAASLQHFSSSSYVDDDDEPRRGFKKTKPSKKKPAEKPTRKSSTKDSDPDSLLIKSLQKHYMEATDLANKYQLQVRGTFKPFEVVANEAGSDLTLRRIIGKEEVLVKCVLDLENPHIEGQGHSEGATSESDDHASDDDDDQGSVDDELGITQRVMLTAEISKDQAEEDKPRMAFLCSYVKGEAICIEDIAYLGKSAQEEYTYSGPHFPDLDDNLKQVFHNVIKTRGINSGLAETIMEHLMNQYQGYYLEWLQNIRAFLVR